jgi:hypothetical protein
MDVNRHQSFSKLNFQNSFNNPCDIAPDQDEYAVRNAANIAWMKRTFEQEKDRDSGGGPVHLASRFRIREIFGDNAGKGTNEVQWAKALVDACGCEVFSYQPQIVTANRVAVPTPQNHLCSTTRPRAVRGMRSRAHSNRKQNRSKAAFDRLGFKCRPAVALQNTVEFLWIVFQYLHVRIQQSLPVWAAVFLEFGQRHQQDLGGRPDLAVLAVAVMVDQFDE